MPVVTLDVDPELRFLLPPRRRDAPFRVHVQGTDTWGHVVQAAGIPLTEVGRLAVDGVEVAEHARVADGVLRVAPVARPQATVGSPPRFLLDVHLGGLARRLRLLGLDVAYRPEADDAELVRIAAAERGCC